MSDINYKEVRIGNETEYNNFIIIYKTGLTHNKIYAKLYRINNSGYRELLFPVSKKYNLNDSNSESLIIDEILTACTNGLKKNYYILENPKTDNYIPDLLLGNKLYQINIHDDSLTEFKSYIKISWIKNGTLDSTQTSKSSDKTKPNKIKIFDFDLNDYENNENKIGIEKYAVIINKQWGSNEEYFYYTGVDQNFTTSTDVTKRHIFDGSINDTRILEQVINSWKNNVGGDYPIMFYPYEVTKEDITYGNLIYDKRVKKYISPISDNTNSYSPTQSTPTNEVIDNKIKLNLEYIKDGYVLKQKEDFSFNVYIGDIPKPTNLNGEELSDEYTEGELYISDEELNSVDEIEQIDELKGADEDTINEIIPYPKDGSISEKQRVAMLNSINNINPTRNFCARGSYNAALNYYNILNGKKIIKYHVPPGLDGGDDAFIQKMKNIGYLVEKKGLIDTSKLKDIISKTNWKIGDVLFYRGKDGNLLYEPKNPERKLNYRFYGHTQIYNGGIRNDGNVWSCDVLDNYGAGFVYGRYLKSPFNTTKWEVIIYRYNNKQIS